MIDEAMETDEGPPPLGSLPSVVALFGAAATAGGVFCPIVSAPNLGAVNYFSSGHGEAVVLLGLSLAVAVCVILGAYGVLAVVACLEFGVLGFGLARLIRTRDAMAEDAAADGAGRVAAAVVEAVQIEWGWAVMLAGVAAALSATVVSARPARQQMAAALLLTAGMICLGLGAGIAIGTGAGFRLPR